MNTRIPTVGDGSDSAAEITRRDALQAGLAGVTCAMGITGITTAASAAPKTESDTTGKSQAGWIDGHSHIWTRDVKSFPLAPGQTVEDLAPPSFTTEELIKVSEPEGVRRVVLIQHHIYHGWDNSYMIDAARRYPGRFRAVGMIDDTSKNPGEQMRDLLKKRVTAFRITPRIRGAEKWLTGPGMAEMWKTSAATRQPMCCLIDASDLPAVDAMCRKYPKTPVVIDHFARIGVDGEIRESDLKQLAGIARHRNTYLKLSAFYALGKKKAPYHDLIPMIRRMLDAYGPERCLWASDCPYQLVDDHTYKASIGLIRDDLDFLSRGDREWLLRKTAEKVYFFDA